MIEAEGLTKRYGGTVAVEDLSMSTVLALERVSRSGLDRPTAGTVLRETVSSHEATVVVTHDPAVAAQADRLGIAAALLAVGGRLLVRRDA
jgi:ABC-type lipoprotein export system ATPase subunit